MRSTLDPRLLLVLLAAGCMSPPLESPQPRAGQSTRFRIVESVRDKVDILFLVDNSASMESMQGELRSRLPQFLKPFQDLSEAGTFADLHIGVVTSDFGAGASGYGSSCTPSSLSGGGDQGRLIALGKKAAPTCQRPRGANFIEYRFGATNNLPPGQSLVDTFTCMASVGAGGCGFEHSLESVYAALHNNIADNAGFLRDDALLVVVFLTNEDDASAPPDSDIFDKNKVAQYGPADSYNRQTRFAVMCGDPLAFPPYGDSNGPLSGCVAAPNLDGNGPGKQYDIGRYRDFFSLPRLAGGVKDSPLDVVLIGIDAPAEPFQVVLAHPSSGGEEPALCSVLDEHANPACLPVLRHSCVNPRNPNFFGDPAVRLNSVINSVPQHALTSICEEDYSVALSGAANLVVSTIQPGCIRDALPRDASGALHIDCHVDEVLPQADGSARSVAVPSCEQSPGAVPCWHIVVEERCSAGSPDHMALLIDHGSEGGVPVAAPPHAYAVAECATVPKS